MGLPPESKVLIGSIPTRRGPNARNELPAAFCIKLPDARNPGARQPRRRRAARGAAGGGHAGAGGDGGQVITGLLASPFDTACTSGTHTARLTPRRTSRPSPWPSRTTPCRRRSWRHHPGTPVYMAPELHTAGRIAHYSNKCDVYAFALVAWSRAAIRQGAGRDATRERRNSQHEQLCADAARVQRHAPPDPVASGTDVVPGTAAGLLAPGPGTPAIL